MASPTPGPVLGVTGSSFTLRVSSQPLCPGRAVLEGKPGRGSDSPRGALELGRTWGPGETSPSQDRDVCADNNVTAKSTFFFFFFFPF